MKKMEIYLEFAQVEKVVIAHLQEQLELLSQSPPLGLSDNELELSEAYKLVLEDHMGERAFQTYMHDKAKKEKKYNSKRLTEAEGGL